jgi:predicted alpha/beta-hydrolase family hydrolase
MREVRVEVSGAAEVSASVHGAGPTLVVLGHGAGSDRRAGLLVRFADALAATGRGVLLYNFPYSEARRRRPDAPAVLEATTRAVDAYARAELAARRVVHGGKSMGGRIASLASAAGMPADALVFLGYPLHPPGRPERLRDGHLDDIPTPMLFLQGTRDAFARRELLMPVIERLGARARLRWIEDGDHSFAVRKSSGRRAAEVETELVNVTGDWLRAHSL